MFSLPKPITLPIALVILFTSAFAFRVPTPLRNSRSTSRSRGSLDVRQTFVFQVGIDKYTSPRVPKLDGCVRDILEMKALLIKKFNVPANHFLTLTDEQATHEAIIQGFRTQLIENARKYRDAVVIFQYSGHGSQVKDREGNKADGLDSTLVPVNSRDLKGSYFDVVDDEIREIFDELSQYTSNITFIIDACHSGNPTRGAGKTRGIPADDRPQPPVTKPRPPAEGETKLRGSELTAMLPPRDQRYVAIAATLPFELANEKSFPEAHRANGALTYYLLRALGRANPETTYRQLMTEVANAVTTDYPNQHPQVEGDIGRPVFGGSANREEPFIEIQDISKDAITIKAGSAQGLTAGTIIAVYAPDARQFSGNEKRLTTGTVESATPFTSVVKLNTMNGVTTASKAVIVSADFGSVRTKVAFAKAAATRGAGSIATLKPELENLLKTSRSIAITGDVDLESPGVRGIDWDVVVKAVAFNAWFQPDENADNKTTRPGDRQVICIVGPDGSRPLFDFYVEVDDSAAAPKLAAALEHLANQRALRAIENETSQLNGLLKINLLRVSGVFTDGKLKIEKEEPIEMPQDVHDYSFDQGELLRLQIANQSTKDLYFTVFDISTDGSVQILYPPPGGAVSLPKGASVKPESLILKLTGPAGYETFKIIASTEKIGSSDFAFLQQSGVTRNAAPASLASFSDWTTAQVGLWISDKVK